jgi:Co/Zn/Cd efflux system component
MTDGQSRESLSQVGSLRRIAAIVATLNLAYFGIEFAVATTIGSVALFADSVDFLEDAAVNLLVLLALGWSERSRAAVGAGLGLLLLMPGIATLWTAWDKLGHPVPPAAVPLVLTGLGALAVNLGCAMLLARWRASGGSMLRAAFLSARNDAIANVAIIAAGALTAATDSLWPDLAVGIGIFAINLDAARSVWAAAHREYRAAAIKP